MSQGRTLDKRTITNQFVQGKQQTYEQTGRFKEEHETETNTFKGVQQTKNKKRKTENQKQTEAPCRKSDKQGGRCG